jgi:hypothetical protein
VAVTVRTGSAGACVQYVVAELWDMALMAYWMEGVGLWTVRLGDQGILDRISTITVCV